jgi:phenylacetic acid degradation operon negative regulatory protein
MDDEILSRLRSAPISRFVYSSLGFFGSRRGGALPGSWFTRSLAPIGIEEASIRQTLWRMERSGVLVARREGRAKLYAATPTTLAIIAGGTEKMLAPEEGAWNGAWTVLHFHFGMERRRERDLVRDILMVEGFAGLGPGLYVHPRDRAGRVQRALGEMGLERHLQVFRGPRSGAETDARFARRLWDLAGIGERYRRFLRRYESWQGPRLDALDPAAAFALRFALVFDYLEVAWDDPDLPPEVLPEGWPGARARTLVRALYEALLPDSIAHADRVLAEVAREPAVR